MTLSRSSRARLLAVASLTAAALLATAASATAATARPDKKKPKPPTYLTIIYDASGSTHLATPGSTVALGPTTLTATLNNETDGFTGSLPLPPTTASFNALGLLPISATVTFIPASGLTGQLTPGTNLTASATTSETIQLSNVTIAGFLPGNVGSTCETTSPVVISTATPAGQAFNPFTGGTLTGTYTLGQFANCGLFTSLINQLVPGSGNTVTLTASNGQLQH
jgi:hypothetical protein